MYRIFCESYENFIKTFDKYNSRIRVSEPLELIVNENKFKQEEKKESELYKKLCDLICFMKDNIERFPRFIAFLWTLDARGIKGKYFNISTKEELEEQAKLINSFLKLAYWY